MIFPSIFAVLALVVVNNALPEALLRNVKSPANSTYVAITSVASENQQCLPEIVKATEVCIKAGVWLFYPDTNFLSTSMPGGTEIYVRNPVDLAMTCYSLPAHLDKKVGSFRLAGNDADETIPTLNVYVNKDYAADELKTSSPLNEVPYAFNSAIITGGGRWQFYMKENYDGFSECTAVGEERIPDFTTRFGVQAGDIKSINTGCTKPFGKLNPNHVFTGYN